MVTPFGVTSNWIAEYLKLISAGVSDKDARIAANSNLRIKDKEFARTFISGPMMLTVPVMGGASILKRKDCNPIVSEHGKWRKEHIGALHATYGRTPYFDHLIHEIEEVYNCPEGTLLEEFNSRLLDLALGWIDIKALASIKKKIGNLDENNTDYNVHDNIEKRYSCIIGDIKNKMCPDLSIFDAIFRYGKESIWGLCI